jgi:alpha-glucosidase
MSRFCCLIILGAFLLASCNKEKTIEITSPDQKISTLVALNEEGELRYQIFLEGTRVIDPSLLGVRTATTDFKRNLKITGVGTVQVISEKYQMLTEKRTKNTYQANEREISVEDKLGNKLAIVFRVSNDGVAFRYHFFLPEGADSIVVEAENTSFKIPGNSKAWMHPHANVKDGWCRSQPSYEESYKIDIPVGTSAPQKAGWSFPALFKTGDKWVLISESGLEPPYCGTRFAQNATKGEYFIAFPQAKETVDSTDLITPVSKTSFYSPWRTIITGTLATIVESNMITALAPPSRISDSIRFEPGIASWSWGVLKDESVNYKTQKEFIDLASSMGWRYCLVDVDWDRRIGYEKVAELAQYAASKNVALILWYNSSGNWNTTVYSPKGIMVEPERRDSEFARISKMGIKGIKVDFWPGDGPSSIKYYYDIMTDAARYGLITNFHGATVARGWSRTFPNLVSMEAVKGFEFTTFSQEGNDANPVHCTILPFTRNALGHMDYTPVCFGEIPHITRKTSSAFELALSILFQSGVQHIVETPASMKQQPKFVVDFMKRLPAYWDDVRFIDGFPGKYVVLARKHANHWYVAGINAQTDSLHLNLDLSPFQPVAKISCISDGADNRSFRTDSLQVQHNGVKVAVAGRGGFVFVL